MQADIDEILTVGHSTRAPGELEALLDDHAVAVVLDVRAHPGSRRMPHFGREALERSLAAAGIGYEHLPELGATRWRRRAGAALGAARARGSRHTTSNRSATAATRAGGECPCARRATGRLSGGWLGSGRRLTARLVVDLPFSPTPR